MDDSTEQRSNEENVSSVQSCPQSEEEAVEIICEDPLFRIDPRNLELPGPNWGFSKIDEQSLLICEIIISKSPATPRIRKHVHVNLPNGICTSYMIDRKISEMQATTTIDVARCIEELHMMHVCVGGPSASKFLPAIRTNSTIDTFGNWRHNSCKIIVSFTGLRCNACESLQYEVDQLGLVNEREKLKSKATKNLTISNLSHRKQSQIISLRKRRQSWYRKQRNAEKEIKLIEDMIAEVSEEPENRDKETFTEDEEEEVEEDDH